METQSPWLTRAGAAEYLGVHTRTLDRYVALGKLRRYKIADTQSVRYRRDELDALMSATDKGEE